MAARSCVISSALRAVRFSELDTLLELAERLGYCANNNSANNDDLRKAVDDVSGWVMGLSASIKRKL